MNSHIAAALATLAFLAPLAPVAHANHDSNPHKGAIERIVRDYLLGNPEVIEEAIDVLRAKGRAEEQKRAEGTIAENGERLRAHPMSPISGNAQGDVTVVEFFAYRCGFCKQALPTMEALPGEDADVRVVWKEFPILGPVSVFAVAAGLDPERFSRDMDDPAIEACLDETQALAREIGITGTPAFVVGATLVPGVVDAARMKELVAVAHAGGGRG